MRRKAHPQLDLAGRRERLSRNLALAALLIIGGLAIAGPSGLLAWSENLRLLDQRKAQLAALQKERANLQNKVELLDPAHADPDMVGELLRSQLNVVHPDEVVIRLDDGDEAEAQGSAPGTDDPSIP